MWVTLLTGPRARATDSKAFGQCRVGSLFPDDCDGRRKLGWMSSGRERVFLFFMGMMKFETGYQKKKERI